MSQENQRTSRRAGITADIKNVLRRLSKNSPSYREDRRYILSVLIEDLVAINRLVPRLFAVGQTSLLCDLITLWRKRGNTDATIRKKIAVLRHVFVRVYPDVIFPNNEQLGISSPKQYKNRGDMLENKIYLSDIKNEILKRYCTLQDLFGLKKMEALRFNQSMIVDSHICLQRNMTYNKRDRRIPVLHESQREFVASIIDNNWFLTTPDRKEERYLSQFFRHELRKHGVKEDDYFRYKFMLSRYEELLREKADTGSKPLAIFKQLRQELGFQGNQEIKRFLYEQAIFKKCDL